MELLSFTVTLTTVLLGVQGHAGHNDANVNVMSQPGQPPTDFHDPNIVGNQAHMREHLREEVGNRADKDMSPEEMEFHYFRLHDTNNDTQLDGLEIMKAMMHMIPPGMEIHPQELQGKTPEQIEKLKKERTYQMLNGIVMMIDNVLDKDDRDRDGYVSYPEYIVARRRDSKQMMKAQQEMLRQAEAYKQQQAAMANQPKTPTFNV